MWVLTLKAVIAMAILSLGLALGGCATGPAGSKTSAKAESLPFPYEPLNVRNSCFVESVHFYDEYLKKHRGEPTWARVLRWGNREGDFQIAYGHAVTVFAAKDRLWFYDVNFGLVPVELPLDRRADITDVSPKVFARYPQFKPTLARYRDDFLQQPAKDRIDFLFYHKNPDVRDATRVANRLGRIRPVRVLEFDFLEGNQKQSSAATAFLFGRQVCLYFPRRGTYESRRYLGAVDDLKFINEVVRRLFPTAENVRWQSGGYLLLPKDKS